jgi:hypothetical protein
MLQTVGHDDARLRARALLMMFRCSWTIREKRESLTIVVVAHRSQTVLKIIRFLHGSMNSNSN